MTAAPAPAVNPVDFDPSKGPPTTADELRIVVAAWHADKGNAGKEFPYQSAARVQYVLDIFIQVLRKNGRDVARHLNTWRLYDEDDGLWHVADVLDVCTLFQEFWQSLTGRTGTARRIADAVGTLAILPSIAPAATAWNEVLRSGAHVTLFACGTLLSIDAGGGATTRRALASDYLTPEQCPRLAASWTPAATCKQTENALYRVFGWCLPPERASRVATLLAWASQILLPGARPKKTYRAAVFFGESDTGKSVLLNVPRAVLDNPDTPASAVCTMPLSGLDIPFGLSELLGKRAWLINEVRTANRLMSDDLLKQIITNEPLTVPIKFRLAINTQLSVLVGVATNALPKMDDVSDGTLSRLVYFETRVRFVPQVSAGAKPGTEQTMIPDLYRIMVAERDGIAQLLTKAACAMIADSAMPISTAMLGETRDTYGAEDTVWQFAEQGLQQESRDRWVSSSAIKRAYRGMVETEEGPDAVRRLDMRWVEKRLFAKLRFVYDVERDKLRVPGGGRATTPVYAQRGVWLTPQGVLWLQAGLRRDDGQLSKPLSDYRLEAERANQPQATATGGNVVTMPGRTDSGN